MKGGGGGEGGERGERGRPGTGLGACSYDALLILMRCPLVADLIGRLPLTLSNNQNLVHKGKGKGEGEAQATTKIVEARVCAARVFVW